MKKIIATNLSGGLGNCVFKYLIAKIIAKHNGYAFTYFEIRGLKHFNFYYYLRNIYKKIYYSKKRNVKQVKKLKFSEYFEIEESILNLFFYRFVYILYSLLSKLKYSNLNNLKDIRIESSTSLNISSQNIDFIWFNIQNVKQWLKIKKEDKKRVYQILDKINVKSSNLCSIHIRRGDYLKQDKGFKYKDEGWALPKIYYSYIINNLLPKNLYYIFITDDLDYVKKEFNFIKNKYISHNEAEVTDLILFSSCKYNIIANSSFSIIGSLLNNHRDSQTFAPKYHIGWSKKEWYPKDIKSKNFKYVDILNVN